MKLHGLISRFVDWLQASTEKKFVLLVKAGRCYDLEQVNFTLVCDNWSHNVSLPYRNSIMVYCCVNLAGGGIVKQQLQFLKRWVQI